MEIGIITWIIFGIYSIYICTKNAISLAKDIKEINSKMNEIEYF